MDGYVPGAVAGILSGSQAVPKTAEEKKLKAKQRALLALFSQPKAKPQKVLASPKQDSTTPEKKEKTAKKRKAVEPDGNEKPTSIKKAKKVVKETTKSSSDPSAKIVGRALQRENRKRKNPEKEVRTIFVGNLPNTIVKRKVETFFKKYGIIESVRFRSAAPSDLKLPKKAIMNTKSFHKELNTMNGYVVFKKKEAAKDALAGNGELLEGNHIRVDLAKDAKKVDTKKSVFVGNLPFDVEDEQLRAHFQDCGKIEGIRVIRESRTGLGKGFGYVKFEDKDGVDMALRLNGHLFSKRTLRVQKAEDMDKTKDKHKNKTSKLGSGHVAKRDGTTGKEHKKNKVGRSMPSNVTSRDFQGVKAKSLGKIKKRQKQKKKFKKQKQKKNAGAEAMAGKLGVVSKKSNASRPNKGNAARARITKKIKKANPRKT